MKIIFEVEDVLKRKILLTEESLKHILEKPAMLNQEDRIKETLINPEIIKRSNYIPTVFLYYRFYVKSPVTQKYLYRQNQKRRDCMGKMKLWYDKESDILEITFENKKGYAKDVGDDVWIMVDERENPIGITVIGFKKRPQEIELPIAISVSEVEA